MDDEVLGESVWRQALWNLVSEDTCAPKVPGTRGATRADPRDRSFRVVEVLREITDELARQLPSRLKLTFEYSGADGDRPVTGDKRALEDLVVLQVARAVHGVGSEAGRIVVRLERVDESEARLDAPQMGAGPRLRILLETFGAGEADANGLDPLFRAPGGAADGDASQGSWSVGWALARRAAARLGGVLCHAPDRASCKAYLPASHLEPRETPVLESEACGPDVGLDLLFVSDEEPILAMGRRALVLSDCSVRIADRGDDVLGLVRARAASFDAVVIADDLSDMAAGRLSEEARAIASELPILVGARRTVALRDHVLTPRVAPASRSEETARPVPGARQQSDSQAR